MPFRNPFHVVSPSYVGSPPVGCYTRTPENWPLNQAFTGFITGTSNSTSYSVLDLIREQCRKSLVPVNLVKVIED